MLISFLFIIHTYIHKYIKHIPRNQIPLKLCRNALDSSQAAAFIFNSYSVCGGWIRILVDLNFPETYSRTRDSKIRQDAPILIIINVVVVLIMIKRRMHLRVLLSFHIISLFFIVSKSIHIEHLEDT